MPDDSQGGGLKERVGRLLAHPATKGLELDDPRTTETRREIIRGKAFLNRLYRDFYAELLASLAKAPSGPVLELGSGGGFLKKVNPQVISSEVFFCSGLDLVSDGMEMPFRDSSLASILMLDVLHHIPRPLVFLKEAARCLMPGGRLAMIEPMNSGWARLVYKNLHPEPFAEKAGWELTRGGPLSSANQAMAWILFFRDRDEVMGQLPELELVTARSHTPLAYLLSGGVSLRISPPEWSYAMVRSLEKKLSPFNSALAMFVTLELVRVR